jgi:hypothetical protein
MKLPIIISFLLGNILVLAQTDSSVNKNHKNMKDTGKVVTTIPGFTANKIMVIQKKDLALIKPIEGMNFIVDGDTLTFSAEEIQSGLTIAELKTIRSNKDSLLSHIKPKMTNEEEKYPFLYQLRKYLGIAKSIGVIIILILSLL